MKILDDETTSKPRDVTWLRTAGSCSFLGDNEYPWWAGHLLSTWYSASVYLLLADANCCRLVSPGSRKFMKEQLWAPVPVGSRGRKESQRGEVDWGAASATPQGAGIAFKAVLSWAEMEGLLHPHGHQSWMWVPWE